jgi:hypothetical protein
MAESTLSLSLTNIKSAIGAYLGISRTAANWSAENLADVVRIINAGERQVYSPSIPALSERGKPSTHVWSFLKAMATITTANGTQSYDLPDDFSGFIRHDGAVVMYGIELAFTTSKDWPLTVVEDWRVLEKIQAGTSMPTGITQPLLASVIPKTFTQSTGQRWQIKMWPTPTSTLLINGRYRMTPNAISSDNNFPHGGEPFAELFLESCLAAAEEMMNDQSSVHRERFREMLVAAVALDNGLHALEAA